MKAAKIIKKKAKAFSSAAAAPAEDQIQFPKPINIDRQSSLAQIDEAVRDEDAQDATTIQNNDEGVQPQPTGHDYSHFRGDQAESPRFDNQSSVRDSVPGNKQGEGAFTDKMSEQNHEQQ